MNTPALLTGTGIGAIAVYLYKYAKKEMTHKKNSGKTLHDPDQGDPSRHLPDLRHSGM